MWWNEEEERSGRGHRRKGRIHICCRTLIVQNVWHFDSRSLVHMSLAGLFRSFRFEFFCFVIVLFTCLLYLSPVRVIGEISSFKVLSNRLGYMRKNKRSIFYFLLFLCVVSEAFISSFLCFSFLHFVCLSVFVSLMTNKEPAVGCLNTEKLSYS